MPIDEIKEMMYLKEFMERPDIKERSALTRLHMWLEDRGAVKLKWFKAPGHAENVKPAIDTIDINRYPIFNGFYSKYQNQKVKI